jgi:hypothetical protein
MTEAWAKRRYIFDLRGDMGPKEPESSLEGDLVFLCTLLSIYDLFSDELLSSTKD